MTPIQLSKLWRPAAWLLLAVLALGVIYCSRLAQGIEAANAALLSRDYPTASQRYQEVLSTFRRNPFLRRVMRGQYQMAVYNQAQALYEEQKYRETVDMLQQEANDFPLLAGTAPYHLWMGNAMFRIAILEEGDDLSFESLQTVADEYGEAIGLDRTDWDAKHNYDFVRDLLAKKGSEDPEEEQALQLLLSRIRQSSTQRQPGVPDQLH